MNIISYNDGKRLQIEKKETYRYLGYHFGGEVSPDEELEKMVDELTKKLKEVITPRCAYEIYHLDVADNACILTPDISYSCVDGSSGLDAAEELPLLKVKSTKLSAHLKECKHAILFAATIGPGADMLIRRYSGRSTIKPAILQAVGAAAIEAFADEITEHIRYEFADYLNRCLEADVKEAVDSMSKPDITIPAKKEDTRFKMRFSPGYGDFSLEHQKDFFRLLQLEKNLGMSLNSALLMSPSKSITAVIGVL